MANPHRATVTVDLGEPPVRHDLCLTNQALREIEAELRVDAPMLLGEPLGITKATVIVHAGLRGANKKVDRKAAVEMLDTMRPADVIRIAIAVLNAAFIDPEPKENPPQEGESPSA